MRSDAPRLNVSRAAYVLDASALLCFMFREPGAERVEPTLHEAVVGAGNLAEVVSKLVDRGFDGAEVLADLTELGFEVAPLDRAQGEAAGLLRAVQRETPLSLGDRLCLALGIATRLPVLTADRRQAEVASAAGIAAEMIR